MLTKIIHFQVTGVTYYGDMEKRNQALKNDRSDKKRKQTFATITVYGFVLILFIFTLVDLIEKQMLEAAVNFGMGVSICFGYLSLKKLDRDQGIYRIVLALLSFFFLYNIHIGSGEGTAIFWLFCFPPFFMFFLGKNEGLAAIAVYLCLLCLLLLNPFSIETYGYSTAVATRFLPAFLVVSLISYGLEASREKYHRLMNLEHQALLNEKLEVEKAVKEIKRLSGLLPICASCKKIRDDDGYWEQVETYISQRTEAGFTHSICPDCFKIHYPELKYPTGD